MQSPKVVALYYDGNFSVFAALMSMNGRSRTALNTVFIGLACIGTSLQLLHVSKAQI